MCLIGARDVDFKVMRKEEENQRQENCKRMQVSIRKHGTPSLSLGARSTCAMQLQNE